MATFDDLHVPTRDEIAAGVRASWLPMAEVDARAPCSAGHAPTEECDRCRGVCLGGGEYSPDAVALSTLA